MERRTVKNYYFKDQSMTGPALMSGIRLPKDPDGIVRNTDFVECDFHPNCHYVKFEDCTFVRCEDPRNAW